MFRILLIFQISFNVSMANWGTPGSGQYHIQTDEGPERYFRYQTDSGQFRKEKRLEDGTVIGNVVDAKKKRCTISKFHLRIVMVFLKSYTNPFESKFPTNSATDSRLTTQVILV